MSAVKPMTLFRVAALGLVALVLLLPGAARAWGPDGHVIVAEIAQRNLKPATKTALRKLLPEEATLADVANWADDVRPSRPETKTWHYVDISVKVEPASYLASRDCKEDGCIVAQIERLAKVLKNKKAAKKDRVEALKFIVHFVGDLHQPLHAADDDDRGGNEKKVRLDLDQFAVKPASSLHGVWDGDLIAAREIGRAAYIGELAALTTEEKAELRTGTVVDWANESHKEGRKTVYGLLPKATTGVFVLKDDYFESGMAVVSLQLQRAGIRLAKILNDALAGGPPPQ
jgi:hypothetical protein